MVRKESDKEDTEEGEDDWLYELLSELAKSDEETESEEEDEEEKDAKEEEVIEEDEGETFFIATVFGGKKTINDEIPAKCADPGPCLVTCKIRGVEIRGCMCDPGAFRSVMPFALYELLDLGPLKKSNEPRIKNEKDKGLRNTPPHEKKKKKKEPMNSVKKKKKFEEDEASKKFEIKCANVDDLIGKLKAFKGALHTNKDLDTHLVQEHSKWK
ncbi:hypothetical protein PIB30_088423 [Stylosanthes scabra]|uniref:Uncharacterized protein n=1 Tax=Stylosanthes scabra TaxID=79078 RepID=A0ABU6UUW7_9FABA|nr:hypothetical protein [Stylosanthes scabra]